MRRKVGSNAMFDIIEDAKWHLGKYRHSRFWAIREGGPNGKLVCLCVYRKGAREVVRRLSGPEAAMLPVSDAADSREGIAE